MKKYLIVILIITTLFSCEKFLQEEPVGVLSYSYYETEQGIEALIKSCYHALRYKTGGETTYGFYEYGTDEYMKGAEWREQYAKDAFNDYTGELNSADWDLNEFWNHYYNGIDRCNVAVDKIPLVEGGTGIMKDQEGKNIRMGEVRFLRAYFYFMLVQQFGAIPLTLEPSSGLELEWERTPVAEVYEAIIDDLKFAVENCTEEQIDYGRVIKDAARHILAKVYLTRASSTVDDVNNANDYRGGNRQEDLTAAVALIEDIESSGLKHSLVPDYADLFKEGNEINAEVIFSIQFNQDEGLNGTGQGDVYKNMTHVFWFLQYDVPDPGMARNIEYGRPFRRCFITDYAIDIHDRLNDSRLRKSLLEVYYSTSTDQTTIGQWTNEELLFAFTNVAPDGSWAIRHGDTIRAGDYKFSCATPIEGSDNVTVGDTAIVFLLNDENTTLTDRQMVASGYKIYARYFWKTNADGSLDQLMTYDRNNDLLFLSDTAVVGSSNIKVATWNRNKSPSLIKYWDRNKLGDYQSYRGSRDCFIARLGESYLIAAEAYGRLGNYTKAVEYINKLRTRAAYKDGEVRSNFWYLYDGGSGTASTEAANLIDPAAPPWTEGNYDPDRELYPPSATDDATRFIHFMLNERCREMLGEMVRWEDLVRTETLYERARLFNDDTRRIGTMKEYHRVRPIVQPHLDGIQRDGEYLTDEEKHDYQNPGYQ